MTSREDQPKAYCDISLEGSGSQECGPWARSISITGEYLRNAPCTYESVDSAGGAQHPGLLCGRLELRATVL